MILSEKSATPAFAGAGFFGIMRDSREMMGFAPASNMRAMCYWLP